MENYSTSPLTAGSYSILPVTIENYNVSSVTTENYSISPGHTTFLPNRKTYLPPAYFIFTSPLVQGLLRAKKVLLPICVFLGLFGNVMTLAITRRFKANRSPMDVYFMGLAVTDLCFIIAGPLPIWIHKETGFQVVTAHNVVCKLVRFAVNVAAGSSAWILVAMATQRAVSVVWPHRVNALCTPRRSGKIILAIIAFFCLAYSHMLYGFGVVRIFFFRACTVASRGYESFIRNVWAKLDIFLCSLLPFVCLFLCNGVLVLKLKTSVKDVNDQLAGTDSQRASRAKIVNSITLTAIIVSLTFVLLSLPLAIRNMVSFLTVPTEVTDDAILRAFLGDFFYLVACFNFSVNFYLYCLTGEKFRNEFKKIFCGFRERLTTACGR